MTHNISILSNDQIIEMAPAAGAWEPIEGVSSRYSFVPTVTAIDLLRDAGWPTTLIRIDPSLLS